MTDMRRYLLGELPEEEAQRLEENYFTDDARFAELLAAEDDLIDAFLRDDLDAADRVRFQSRFLATARGRQKIAVAAALQNAQPAMRIAWGGRMLAAAAVLIVVIIGAWTYREFGIMQRRIEQLERERSALRSQLALAIRSTATTPIFSIILSGGERGSGQASTLMLPRSPAIVNVWLLLPPHARAATYTATLQSVDGRTLWTVGGLTPRSVDERQTVVASIPSSILAQGTFVISLSAGGQTIEDYSFSVRQ